AFGHHWRRSRHRAWHRDEPGADSCRQSAIVSLDHGDPAAALTICGRDGRPHRCGGVNGRGCGTARAFARRGACGARGLVMASTGLHLTIAILLCLITGGAAISAEPNAGAAE